MKDKIKEEIGWLKLIFGLTAATDLSLIAWAFQKYTVMPDWLFASSVCLILVMTYFVIWINLIAYRKINLLGEA